MACFLHWPPVDREHLLEQRFVQCRRWREGTEAADQQQPAPQLLLLLLQVPRVINQLGQNLVPQRRPALALLHYVVTQHPLLPVAQVVLPSEAQDLRKGEL